MTWPSSKGCAHPDTPCMHACAGSGLSSSSALVCASALAFLAAHDVALPQVVRACMHTRLSTQLSSVELCTCGMLLLVVGAAANPVKRSLHAVQWASRAGPMSGSITWPLASFGAPCCAGGGGVHGSVREVRGHRERRHGPGHLHHGRKGPRQARALQAGAAHGPVPARSSSLGPVVTAVHSTSTPRSGAVEWTSVVREERIPVAICLLL